MKSIASGAAILLLSACGQPPDTATKADQQAGDRIPVEPDSGTGSGATPPPVATPKASVAADTIPATIRGRWGLVSADCTSTLGDAKGLLTIGANKLEFYESVGILGTVDERSTTRIKASFSFNGEGMKWQRDMILDAQEDGKTLLRREYGEGAASGPFKYTRC